MAHATPAAARKAARALRAQIAQLRKDKAGALADIAQRCKGARGAASEALGRLRSSAGALVKARREELQAKKREACGATPKARQQKARAIKAAEKALAQAETAAAAIAEEASTAEQGSPARQAAVEALLVEAEIPELIPVWREIHAEVEAPSAEAAVNVLIGYAQQAPEDVAAAVERSGESIAELLGSLPAEVRISGVKVLSSADRKGIEARSFAHVRWEGKDVAVFSGENAENDAERLRLTLIARQEAKGMREYGKLMAAGRVEEAAELLARIEQRAELDRAAASAIERHQEQQDARPWLDAITVALVSCGKSKASEPRPARELYTGGLFRASYEWATRHADRVFILSAKHGLVEPEQVIAPYDHKLSEKSKKERQAWGERVVSSLFGKVRAKKMRIIVLAGQEYADALPLAWEAKRLGRDVSVEKPLKGKSQGERLAFFAQERKAEEKKPEGQVSPISDLDPVTLRGALIVLDLNHHFSPWRHNEKTGRFDSETEMKLNPQAASFILDRFAEIGALQHVGSNNYSTTAALAGHRKMSRKSEALRRHIQEKLAAAEPLEARGWPANLIAAAREVFHPERVAKREAAAVKREEAKKAPDVISEAREKGRALAIQNPNLEHWRVLDAAKRHGYADESPAEEAFEEGYFSGRDEAKGRGPATVEESRALEHEAGLETLAEGQGTALARRNSMLPKWRVEEEAQRHGFPESSKFTGIYTRAYFAEVKRQDERERSGYEPAYPGPPRVAVERAEGAILEALASGPVEHQELHREADPAASHAVTDAAIERLQAAGAIAKIETAGEVSYARAEGFRPAKERGETGALFEEIEPAPTLGAIDAVGVPLRFQGDVTEGYHRFPEGMRPELGLVPVPVGSEAAAYYDPLSDRDLSDQGIDAKDARTAGVVVVAIGEDITLNEESEAEDLLGDAYLYGEEGEETPRHHPLAPVFFPVVYDQGKIHLGSGQQNALARGTLRAILVLGVEPVKELATRGIFFSIHDSPYAPTAQWDALVDPRLVRRAQHFGLFPVQIDISDPLQNWGPAAVKRRREEYAREDAEGERDELATREILSVQDELRERSRPYDFSHEQRPEIIATMAMPGAWPIVQVRRALSAKFRALDWGDPVLGAVLERHGAAALITTAQGDLIVCANDGRGMWFSLVKARTLLQALFVLRTHAALLPRLLEEERAAQIVDQLDSAQFELGLTNVPESRPYLVIAADAAAMRGAPAVAPLNAPRDVYGGPSVHVAEPDYERGWVANPVPLTTESGEEYGQSKNTLRLEDEHQETKCEMQAMRIASSISTEERPLCRYYLRFTFPKVALADYENLAPELRELLGRGSDPFFFELVIPVLLLRSTQPTEQKEVFFDPRIDIDFAELGRRLLLHYFPTLVQMYFGMLTTDIAHYPKLREEFFNALGGYRRLEASSVEERKAKALSDRLKDTDLSGYMAFPGGRHGIQGIPLKSRVTATEDGQNVRFVIDVPNDLQKAITVQVIGGDALRDRVKKDGITVLSHFPANYLQARRVSGLDDPLIWHLVGYVNEHLMADGKKMFVGLGRSSSGADASFQENKLFAYKNPHSPLWGSAFYPAIAIGQSDSNKVSGAYSITHLPTGFSLYTFALPKDEAIEAFYELGNELAKQAKEMNLTLDWSDRKGGRIGYVFGRMPVKPSEIQAKYDALVHQRRMFDKVLPKGMRPDLSRETVEAWRRRSLSDPATHRAALDGLMMLLDKSHQASRQHRKVKALDAYKALPEEVRTPTGIAMLGTGALLSDIAAIPTAITAAYDEIKSWSAPAAPEDAPASGSKRLDLLRRSLPGWRFGVAEQGGKWTVTAIPKDDRDIIGAQGDDQEDAVFRLHLNLVSEYSSLRPEERERMTAEIDRSENPSGGASLADKCRATREEVRALELDQRALVARLLEIKRHEIADLRVEACDAPRAAVREKYDQQIAKLTREAEKYEQEARELEARGKARDRAKLPALDKGASDALISSSIAAFEPRLLPLWRLLGPEIEGASAGERLDVFLRFVQDNPGEAAKAQAEDPELASLPPVHATRVRIKK